MERRKTPLDVTSRWFVKIVLRDSESYAAAPVVTSVVSDSVRPHGQQPTRLPRPWDSPGKNTGVGCHFLVQCMKVKSESEVAQSCPTLSDLMACSLPGLSVHGIFQTRGLECLLQQWSWENAYNQGPAREPQISSRALPSCSLAHSLFPKTLPPATLECYGLRVKAHSPWGPSVSIQTY